MMLEGISTTFDKSSITTPGKRLDFDYRASLVVR